MRYTPAGVPVLEFRLAHVSEQDEASVTRRVECELACVALGTMALQLQSIAPGTALTVSGFLAAKSLKQRIPVLHVSKIEFAEHI